MKVIVKSLMNNVYLIKISPELKILSDEVDYALVECFDKNLLLNDVNPTLNVFWICVT